MLEREGWCHESTNQIELTALIVIGILMIGAIAQAAPQEKVRP
jgi:hypothetical protein